MAYPGIPENPPSFNIAFDYSVWIPGTMAVLVNVPWDSSYRDIVLFDSEKERAAYFAARAEQGEAVTVESCVYLKYAEPIRINVPFSGANRCNYIVVKNPEQPIPYHGGIKTPDTFYYFINDIRYISPNTTELVVQLDVWMTYYDRITFQYCYIERGHIGIANENSTIDNLADYLTEPEGLEIGNEYDITGQYFHNMQEITPYIVIMSTAKLDVDWGTIDKPSLVSSDGSINNGLPAGTNAYVLDADSFLQLMYKLQNAPWVSQCITYITAVPNEVLFLGDAVRLNGVPANLINDDVMGQRSFTVNKPYERFSIPSRYSELLKMYTSPFSAIEMTAYNGGEIMLKPECLKGLSDSIIVYYRSVCAPPDIRAYYYVAEYNSGGDTGVPYVEYYAPSGEKSYTTINAGEFIDKALTLDDFPQFSLVNNSYISYLASTRNTRAYQEQTAGWTQQKALTGAQLAFNQSNATTSNMLENAGLGIQNAWANNAIANEQATWGGVKGVIGGAANAGASLASGNAVGVASGAISGVMAIGDAALQSSWNSRQTGLSTTLAANTAANNARLSNYIKDSNYEYASFAAKGDYANTIAAIQAKVDDARLTQPSTSGQNGGNAFNMANGLCGVFLKFKRLKTHFMNQIGEYWLRYGYAIGRWIKPTSLHCMTKVTYWKMQNAMITAQIPELHKNAIRGIFESGTSIWHRPDEINAVDLGTNKALKGVRY